MGESKGLRRKVKKHELKAQVLEGNPMVVAMDLAKKRHAVWVTDRSRRPLGRFMVDHSADGMSELDHRVKALCAEKGYDRPVFFMEPTANFWKNVTQALGSRGHTYRLVPGLATARQREIDSASFAKSDYKDAEMISNLGLNLNFCARQLETGDVWTEMSYLAAEYQDVTDFAIREKVRIRSFLDLVCPEYLGIVGERYYTTKSSLAILMAFPEAPPGEIPPLDAWIQKVRPHFRGKHLRLKIVRAVHAALAKGGSYGVDHLWKSVSWRVKQAAERHLLYQAQLEGTQAELLQRYRTLPYAKHLDTIRGVSETQNATVLAFMGDPAQYDDSSCVVKLAGTEPGQNESGDSFGKTPMTHRGRGRLRLAASRATFTLLLQNLDFQEYMLRLMARDQNPLKFLQAFVACMNKYLRMVYTMCRTRQPYQSELVRPQNGHAPLTQLAPRRGLEARHHRMTLEDKLRTMRGVLRGEEVAEES